MLPAVGNVVKGTIVGLVTKAGKPLANDYVEVCKFPDSRIHKGSTPCASRDVHGLSHTDAGGKFAIGDLPLNDYTVVIKDGDLWYSLLGSSCAGMKSGERCDVGELDISKTIDLPH